MFDELSEKLEGIIRKLGGKAVLNEEAVDESLREIRRVLLEADVNYKLVQDFLGSVREKATGKQVVKSVSPGQMMVKVVHDELVEMLGGELTLDSEPGKGSIFRVRLFLNRSQRTAPSEPERPRRGMPGRAAISWWSTTTRSTASCWPMPWGHWASTSPWPNPGRSPSASPAAGRRTWR